MKVMEKFQTLFLVAGIGFFLISFLGMGLAPWTTLKGLQPPPGYQPYSKLEKQGRQIYMEEGCWHCHTQFVRPVSNEPLYYGPVSSAAEYLYEVPQLFGTRRVGPDLWREGGKRTDDWHYAHLYNPRYTVPWSVMPAFPWLFEKKDGKIVPTQRARALVAYLQALGRDKRPIMERQDSLFRATFRVSSPPPRSQTLLDRGRVLFQRECSGCHGEKGDGQGKARPFLAPPPKNLTTVHPTLEYTYTVLTLGRPGSAMPNFRQYPDRDRWALAYYVDFLFKNPPIPPEAPQKTPDLLALGRQQYDQLCSSCHGPQGLGDGPAAAALKPKPAIFPKLRPSVMHVWNTLKTGVQGTGMVSYAALPDSVRWALAYYVEELVQGNAPPAAQPAPAASAPAASSTTSGPASPSSASGAAPKVKAPEPTPDLLARGKQLFAQTCVPCHGVKGDGKGPAGAALNPPPANFTDNQWLSGTGKVEEIFQTITHGRPGTAMAPYNFLPEKDRWALAYIVKSFSDPNLRKKIP